MGGLTFDVQPSGACAMGAGGAGEFDFFLGGCVSMSSGDVDRSDTVRDLLCCCDVAGDVVRAGGSIATGIGVGFFEAVTAVRFSCSWLTSACFGGGGTKGASRGKVGAHLGLGGLGRTGKIVTCSSFTSTMIRSCSSGSSSIGTGLWISRACPSAGESVSTGVFRRNSSSSRLTSSLLRRNSASVTRIIC